MLILSIIKNIKNYIKESLEKAQLNYNKIYAKNRVKALILIIIFILLMLSVLFVSIKIFTKPSLQTDHSYKNNTYRYTGQSDDESVSSSQKVLVSDFLEAFKKTVEIFAPIFDSFISETADVTGKSKPSGNSYLFNLAGNYQTKFVTGAKMKPASYYSQKLLSILAPILTLIIVIEGFNTIADGESSPLKTKTFVKRLLLTGGMLVITPYILSFSILSMNFISRKLTGGDTLTEFLTQFVETVQTEYELGTSDRFISTLSTASTAGVTSTVALVKSVPILLPFLLILLLFLYISFQFIIRFLNLYFLASIYPFAIVGYLSPKLAKIPSNFWQQWTTFLIHQPVFVLGYIIVQNLLLEMLESGASFEQVLVFLALLMFLSTINQLSARLWGNVFTAISSNIMAGGATAITAKTLMSPISKGQQLGKDTMRGGLTGYGNNIASAIGANVFSGIKPREQSLSKINPLQSKFTGKGLNPTSKSNLRKVNHASLSDGTKSKFAQRLEGEGIKVLDSSVKEGTLDVEGDFYTYKNKKTGLTSMYTNKKAATTDGIPKKDLVKKHVKDFTIRDLSNFQAKAEYNRKAGKLAKQNKDFSGKTHLKDVSSDDWVSDNMQITKKYNKNKGVKGLMVNRIPKDAPRGAGKKDRITKIHAYSLDEATQKNND